MPRSRSLRNGFLTPPEELAQERATETELQRAIHSPFTGGLELHMAAVFNDSAEVGPVVDSLVHVDLHQLVFSEAPDGMRRSVIDVLAMATGKVGSANQSLRVPETAKDNFALSSIVIAGEGDSSVPKYPKETLAIRVFQPGHEFVYGYQILNPLLDDTKCSQLEVRTTLTVTVKRFSAVRRFPFEVRL